MGIVFQQPGTSYLLDAIANLAADCEFFGGMFAFATKEGVSLLLDSPDVAALLARGRQIKLVVGLDAITNGETLLDLGERVARSDGTLDARGFLHPYAGIFHPKFAWFVKEGEVRVIVGSGNLTPSGFGSASGTRYNGNWEAFGFEALSSSEGAQFLRSIEDWYTWATSAQLLLPVHHPRVLARGAANSRIRVLPRRGAGDESPQPNARPPISTRAPLPTWPLPASVDSLQVRPQTSPIEIAPVTTTGTVGSHQPIAESSSPNAFLREVSRNRPGQADVGHHGLEFFGFKGDSDSTVLLQYVSLNNSVGEASEKQLFVNASDNYRVEMGEIASFPYDVGQNDERMIMVAVKLDNRTYRYSLVPVGHASYRELSTFLSNTTTTRRPRMREVFVSSAELAENWPSGPTELFPISANPVEI